MGPRRILIDHNTSRNVRLLVHTFYRPNGSTVLCYPPACNVCDIDTRAVNIRYHAIPALSG